MQSRQKVALTAEQVLVQRAIAAAGGASRVAKEADIIRTSVYKWVYRGQIPAEQLGLMSQLSGIAERVLRPDLYKTKPLQVAL